MIETRTPPRRFHLYRRADPTGLSGTGIVAEGTLWSSGAVALHWPGNPRSTSVWAGLDALLAAHGHDGLTEVRWIDGSERPAVIALPDLTSRNARG